MIELRPGDIISYSAGSTETGPYGFRKTKARVNLLTETESRFPGSTAAIGDRTVLFINAYPATVGPFLPGISVDTYLSPRIMSRALTLGSVENHPVILVAQPLFLVDALLKHIRDGRSLPDTLLLWVGGYVMHRSLERMLMTRLAPLVKHVSLIQYFGTAEVDAGCMMARDRNEDGQLVYYPRSDVDAELDGEELLLTLRNSDGSKVIERFRSGDRARRYADGFVVWNAQRLHPSVDSVLEAFSDEDWTRRTGYVKREGEIIWKQLREGEMPRDQTELEHYDFARRFGFSWLNKPWWR